MVFILSVPPEPELSEQAMIGPLQLSLNEITASKDADPFTVIVWPFAPATNLYQTSKAVELEKEPHESGGAD